MAEEKYFYEDLDPESQGILTENFPNGFFFPQSIKNFADMIRKMKIRDDDIWVCTFPKSVSVTFDPAENLGLPKNSVENVEKLASPRYIKTHLPFNLLPENLKNFSTNAKIIHVMRNPRDTMISFYHHFKLFDDYKGSLSQFAKLFFKGLGPLPAHLKGYLAHEGNPKILFLNYEDMKKDLKSVIRKTANFIGKSISKSEVEKLLDHLSFTSMKQNPAINFIPMLEMIGKKSNLINEDDGQFIRRGIVGEWKERLNSELLERFQKWEQETMNEIDFSFSI